MPTLVVSAEISSYFTPHFGPDVYSYDTSSKLIENIPIVTGATAYDGPVTDMTYILVFHESHFYGARLDHSLINPNQIRAYGIPIWDNPYDPQQSLAIDVVNDSLSISLQPLGAKLQFRTRVTSCITMTSPQVWNTADVQMVQEMVQGGIIGP